MPRPSMRHRRRVRTTTGLLAGFALGATALTTVATSTSASGADPVGDCATPYPIADLVKGQSVEGLTVDEGTTPEGFTGTVLGVLQDGVAPGVDMVMVRLSSPEIDRVGGIWQGMSGSPVYADAEHTRLIGAVAYGLAYGPSPVAGVTPFDDMDEYLTPATPPVRRVDLSNRQARTVARAAGVTVAQADQGLRRLPMPTAVTGVDKELLAQAQSVRKGHAWLARHTYATAGAAAAGGPGADTIVAGGNLAVSSAYGDITMAGVGTATSVCNGEVVGFGHPFGFYGDTTLALHPADAVYVQEDPVSAPFKIANLGDPVGTIFGDHLTGITGSFGALPDATRVTSTVTKGAKSRTGTTHAPLRTADNLANTAFNESLANHDAVLDGLATGNEVMGWRIAGTGPNGTPFTLRWTDRYLTTYDTSIEMGFTLGDLVYSIAGIRGVTLTSITSDGTVSTDTSSYRLTGLQQRHRGQWANITRRRPAIVKAGGTLVARALLRADDGSTRTMRVRFPVPKHSRGKVAELQLAGGTAISDYLSGTSVGAIRRKLDANVRNDAIEAQFGRVKGRYDFGDFSLFRGRDGGRVSFDKTRTLGPVSRVIRGVKSAPVVIR